MIARIIALALVLALSCFGVAVAQTVQADHSPVVERLQGQIIVPYDIKTVSIDGKTIWQYREHRVPDIGQVFGDAERLAAIAVATERNTMADDAAALLADLSYAQIDTHVDATFSQLTVAQRTSLKKLYKVVLYLLKDQQG